MVKAVEDRIGKTYHHLLTCHRREKTLGLNICFFCCLLDTSVDMGEKPLLTPKPSEDIALLVAPLSLPHGKAGSASKKEPGTPSSSSSSAERPVPSFGRRNQRQSDADSFDTTQDSSLGSAIKAEKNPTPTSSPAGRSSS